MKQTKLRIGIIVLNFLPNQMGGVEEYLKQLLTGLGDVDSTNDYFVFVPQQYLSAITVSAKKIQLIGISESFWQKVARKLGWSKAGAAKIINSYKLDVLHFPLQIIYPLKGLHGKKVITMMDIQQEYFPEFFSAEERNGRAKQVIPSISRANRIIVISKFTKQTLIDTYHTAKEKISVVYLCFDDELFGSKSYSKELTLPKKYFYYPAATWPHKNHARLIEAFEALQQQAEFKDYALVLTGISKQKSAELDALVADKGLEESVIRLGFIKKEQQPQIYRQAVALVYPSLFEGFGIPTLEAMAAGCPVLCSNTTSLPEVVGDAALTFDPIDASSIASAMIKMASSPKLRQNLIAAGTKRIGQFSGEKMAKQTLAVYRQVMEGIS